MNDSERQRGRYNPVSAGAKRPRVQIIHHQSSLINSDGFTLIELLVVVAVIALLMAILLPTLQRVRNQARAVACQAKLRQWGTLYVTAIAENNGQWPGQPDGSPPQPGDDWVWGWGWGWGDWGLGYWGRWGDGRDRERYEKIKDILHCPMATRPANPTDEGSVAGGTFLAWGLGGREYKPDPWFHHGSYGVNRWAHPYRYSPEPGKVHLWNPANARNPGRIPMYVDSCWPWTEVHDRQPPPPCDAIPTREVGPEVSSCINRHDGYVNGLFLDWSVRRIGLKELWTLKWHRDFNPAGPWTKAGGVEPEDWPQWLRRFKDY